VSLDGSVAHERESGDLDVSNPARGVEVAIVGAGAGGLCMARGLRERGIDDIVILEKSDGVGGTWRDNTYPDAACDVPSHLYSFSFDSKADWSRKWAKQPEILEYFERLVRRHDLERHLQLRTEVAGCRWLEESGCWELRTAAGDRLRAGVVVCALGQLNVPHIPDLPGLEDFGGTVFHSARWDHHHDLRGERVGVIGIGASAIQFVPPVADRAASVALFQRSPNYVGPKRDREFRRWERWVFSHVPGVQRLYRWSIYWRHEARFALMRRNSRLGRVLQEAFRRRIRGLADHRLPMEALMPDHPPGCKRVLIADRWYPTLRRDHVEVVTAPVTGVTAQGVECADGRHVALDTLIFGTGFRTTELLTPIEVTGRDDEDLDETWAGGASAYLGMAMAGFPNLFLLYGPNTNLGHNSILFMIEQQVGYVLAALAEMHRRGATAMEVTEGAMLRWDREMRRRSADTVWAEGCNSWYKTADGRLTNNWVGRTTEYRRRLRRPRWTDWSFRSTAGPRRPGYDSVDSSS
jgi:cation diffusion facilitator CzcD-associated flavoprotein CzcO